MSKTPKLRRKDIRALKNAVRDASGWRGSVEPEAWPSFDATIRKYEQALRRVEAVYLQQVRGAIQ